jgi:hypothetical protein
MRALRARILVCKQTNSVRPKDFGIDDIATLEIALKPGGDHGVFSDSSHGTTGIRSSVYL